MAKVIIGWVVRTETAGRHRYWQVGEADPYRAGQIARNYANAHVARAVTRLPTWELPKFQPAPGAITEIVWETKHVAGPYQLPVLEGQTDGGGAMGEITFDIVVPEDGVTCCVEGCYRIDGGNWQVYYVAKEDQRSGAPHIRSDAVFSSGLLGVIGIVKQSWSKSAWDQSSPHIRSVDVFSSGILGVSGIVPANWILNKKTVMGILAVAEGVEVWTEVFGPDSLILK